MEKRNGLLMDFRVSTAQLAAYLVGAAYNLLRIAKLTLAPT